MAYTNTYDNENNLIILHYEGRLTADEVVESFTDTRHFFVNRSGKVGIVVNASLVSTLPPSILTYARNAPFTRYKPLIFGIVGANTLVRSVANIFSMISGITVRMFDTEPEAIEAILEDLQASQSGS